MNGIHWIGAMLLAIGTGLFLLGIGYVARDEMLGWLGVATGPAPFGFGFWLMRKPDEKKRRR